MPTEPIEILLVTGPLGAGKTTVVNRLLRAEIEAGRKVAVLINEFGAISVDDALVEAARPELAGIENLVDGCACCTLHAEVVQVLAQWADRPEDSRPRRVVLETTGLADPTDLLDLESAPELQGRIRLAGCLTVVSALTPLHHLTQRPLVHRQAAVASLIYISKADQDPSQAMAWESQLRAALKGPAVVHSRQGLPPADSPDPWAGDLVPLPEGWARNQGPSFAQARSLAVTWDGPIDPEGLERLFTQPLPGGELLRAKGVVAFLGWAPRADGSDRWAFQVADGRIEIMPLPAFPDQPLPPLVGVVIGTGLDMPAWREALNRLAHPGPLQPPVWPGSLVP